MHTYIDFDKTYNFDKGTITLEEVEHDLFEKYKITNIDYDYEDAVDVLTHELLYDYNDHMVNYKGLIENGINARILFELRKNAYLKFSDSVQRNFCKMHNSCDTCEEIAKLRKEFVHQYLKGYEDLDWQYVITVKDSRGIDPNNFYFDFDVCFIDRKSTVQRTPDDYRNEFIDAQMHNFNLSLRGL